MWLLPDELLYWTLNELYKQAQQWDGEEFTTYVEVRKRKAPFAATFVLSFTKAKETEG